MSQLFNIGPNVFHPEKPSAVGSRNSLYRNDRDEYEESKALNDEEVDKILNHIHSKLPPEVLSRLHVTGNLKELLHNYYNQSFQNMYNRYITTVEDELAKKFRLLVDKEEFESLNRYTPKEISKLISQVGGDDKFNSSETEKSIVNIYGHLQGHIQSGVYDIEQMTNNLLRQKTDVGAFVRGENSYSIVKCSISDNYSKPETVTNINLTINITSEELISPIYHYKTLSNSIIKELVKDKVLENINENLDHLNSKLMDEGSEEMNAATMIFERINRLGDYYDDSGKDDQGKYSIVSKELFGKLEGDEEAKDVFSVKSFLVKSLNKENIRNRGFNTALNSICNILDTSKMGYQYAENFKNIRKAIISEYKQNVRLESPDESFNITIEYADPNQLREKRIAYQQQIIEFGNEVDKLDGVAAALYQKHFIKERGFLDYNVYKESVLKTKGGTSGKDDDDEEEEEKLWNELTFIPVEKTAIENQVPTFSLDFTTLNRKMKVLKEKIKTSFANQFPDERIAIEDRIDFLEKSIHDFYSGYNPFHCNPGLLISVDMRSIKRKLKTMKGMSNVLNEFLYGLSQGFSDKAFATFSRRRSTDKTLTDEEWKTVAQKGVRGVSSEIEGVAEL